VREATRVYPPHLIRILREQSRVFLNRTDGDDTNPVNRRWFQPGKNIFVRRLFIILGQPMPAHAFSESLEVWINYGFVDTVIIQFNANVVRSVTGDYNRVAYSGSV
jgi:hypothetical protein